MADTHISTVIREYATVAGILVAGGWALWRWGFEEWIRRHRDFPAVDGDISVNGTSLGNEKIAIVLNALWRNKGKLPIELNTAKTFVAAYKVEPAVSEGPLAIPSPGVSLAYRANPLADSAAYILEPTTDSIMQQCFVVPSGETFLFHWAICIAASQKAYPYLKSDMWWTRYLIWRMPTEPAEPPCGP